jgi:hypothetical protein
MPKYAHFDHTEPAPQRVRGWFDTDRRTYAAMPNPADLLQLTDAQWDARMTNPSGWTVKDGVLMKPMPVIKPQPMQPPPTTARPQTAAPTSITIPKQPSG